jgi:hypothetical protein
VLAIIGVVALLAIGGVLLLGSATDQLDHAAMDAFEESWAPVTTASGNFTVDMPGSPERQSMKLPTMSDVGVEMLFAGDGDMNSARVGMLVMEEDLSSVIPTGSPVDFDAVLDGMSNGTMAQRHGQVSETHRVESPIGPAGRFTGHYPDDDLAVSGFAVLRENRVLAILVIVPDDRADEAEGSLDRAIASLKAA